MSLPDALMFQVGLIDKISKPLGNIQRQFNDMGRSYRDGTHTMVAGAAGVAGAGFALQAALMPAIEMDRVLGEVKSLGVADEQLQKLSDTALNFAVEYGKSATDFVAASYQIKSAMGDLTGDELANLTKTAAVTAAATKADTGVITDYFGTMYGIFENQAKAIGKDAWADQLGSYTALAVEKFKTDGVKLSQTFRTLGNTATDAGVKLGEQFAVLGILSNQMDGSVAATKYQAFISKAARAGDKLGLNFLDANNQLLDAASIIEVIQSKYGTSLDALEKMKLEKAFGGKEAMSFISTLYSKTGDLRQNIEAFSQVKGLETAEQMAGAMTDQWERFEQLVFAIRASFGQALLPVILPVVESIADGGKEILLWTKLFPNLTKYIGLAGVAVLGMVAAGGLLTMMVGIGKQAMVAFTLTMKVWAGMNFLLTKGMVALRAAVLAANIMIAANPIVLVIAAIVAAVAAVGALIYYWDDLKASFGDTTWFQILEGAITLLTAPFQAAFQLVKGGWQWVMSGFTDTSGFDGLFALADRLRNIFGSVFGWINEQLSGVWEMAKGVMDWIPGFGDDDKEIKSQSVQKATPRAAIQPGGAAKNIASYQTSSTHYGGISMYVQQMNNPQDMANELEMAAG